MINAGENPDNVPVAATSKIFYKINFDFEELDLISFKQIVRNNNENDVIEFELFIHNAEIDYKILLEKLKLDKNKFIEKELIDIIIKMEIFKEDEVDKFIIQVIDKYGVLNHKRLSFLNPFFQFLDNFHKEAFFNSLSKIENIEKNIDQIKIEYKFFYAIPDYFYRKILNFASSNRTGFLIFPNVRIRPKPFFLLSSFQFDEKEYYGIPFLMDYENENYDLYFRDSPIKMLKEHAEFYKNYLTEEELKDPYFKPWCVTKEQYEAFDKALKESLEKFKLELNSKDYKEKEYEQVFWFWKSIIKAELKFLELADDINIVKNKEFSIGWLEYVKFNSNVKLNLSQASSGLIQIFPVIFFLFLDTVRIKKPVIMIIEQPELHLHPKLQTKFIETLIRYLFLAKCNFSLKKYIFLETHSEHILRKIQLEIAKNPQLNDLVSVYFLNEDKKNNRTTVEKIEIDENGFLKTPFPEGFFDEASELALALLEAQLKRKN